MDNIPRFEFNQATKQWIEVNEKEYYIPKLVNTEYVDCDPNELWIDLITGEVKETPNLQTAAPTPSENE